MAREMHSIEELGRKRRQFLEVAEDNDSKEGLLDLLTRVYPDTAHFVYELLQKLGIVVAGGAHLAGIPVASLIFAIIPVLFVIVAFLLMLFRTK